MRWVKWGEEAKKEGGEKGEEEKKGRRGFLGVYHVFCFELSSVVVF